MKADIARTIIIIAVIFCFSYTIKGLIHSAICKFTSGGLSDGVIILYASGDCGELEKALFSAVSAEPALIAIIANNLTSDGKRLCEVAKSYRGVMLFESLYEAAEYIDGEF